MSCFLGMAQERRIVVDGGFGVSKSFADRAQYLSSQYGIEIYIPDGFSDITAKVKKFSFSSQPVTKSCATYCPVLCGESSFREGECGTVPSHQHPKKLRAACEQFSQRK